MGVPINKVRAVTAKHIILIGFKHVGKSTVGRALAKKLQWPFIDLDRQIEQNFRRQSQQALSCREIFKQRGELFFRNYETQTLMEVLTLPTAVIALGGGAPLREDNQALLKSHWLIHLTASPSIVYERVMARGKPAFFPEDTDPVDFFQHLWNQRQPIYAKLADLTVDNTQSIAHTVDLILEELEKTE